MPPTDTRIARADPKTIERTLDLARGAHMNFLRVHAHVDHPWFYDAADRMGLLLWQDMPLQWLYAHEVMPEAVRQTRAMVRLLYNHPSVALWCCHNEPFYVADTKDESAGAVLATLRSLLVFSWNRDVMDRRMADAAAEEDPTRKVVPSSGELPIFREGTDLHFYGGWYRIMGTHRAFDRLARRLPRALRFVTEFGAQSFPNIENATKFMAADFARVDWKLLETRYGLQTELMDHWTPRERFRDLGAYIQATQDYQSRINRHYIDRFRARKYKPNGGCVAFLFHDPNPAILWSVVDYWRTPKSSYAAMADAYRPLYVFALIPRDRYRRGQTVRARIMAVNDAREPAEGLTVEAVAVDDEGREIFRAAYGLDLPADSEAVDLGVAAFRAHIMGTGTLTLRLTGSGDPFINEYQFEITE
ncbi:MAG: hypothetical protein M5R36_18515 [Deltaproteobacteria bacterium]|nr:hypothetical protein [Deltaproteobacteria bacterium]